MLHDLTAAASVADTLVRLDGRIVATGSPADVLEPRTLSRVYAHAVDLVRYGDDGLVVVAGT